MSKYIFIFIIFIFCSCSSVKDTDNKNTETEYSGNSTKTLEELIAVNQGISSLPGVNIEVSLWRNLMPMSENNNVSGLNINLRLAVTDSSYRNIYSVQKIWVINYKKIWESKPANVTGSDTMLIEYTAGGGPRWKTGAIADVVIQIKSGENLKLIKLKGLVINAVY